MKYERLFFNIGMALLCIPLFIQFTLQSLTFIVEEYRQLKALLDSKE